MTIHLYFSLIPEALIASMLSPEEFGSYYSVGMKFKTRGQAMFFELDPDFRHPYFDIEEAYRRCVPHPDGSPKHSVYISVYRVLEHIPISALKKLYLVTAYGHTMGLERSAVVPDNTNGLAMYQDIAPVTSLVVSTLGPKEYYHSITTQPTKLINFPALCFVDLGLGELASNPENGAVGDMPYTFISHLRECLMELNPQTKTNKMVDRLHTAEFPYRMIKTGIYVGNGEELAFYPMPSRDELRSEHHRWWRSANQ